MKKTEGLKRYSIFWYLGIAVLIIVVTAFLVPLFFSFAQLFTSEKFVANDVSTNVLNHFAENVIKFFSMPRLRNAIIFSVLQAFFSCLISLLLGIPAAYYLSKKKIVGSKILNSLSCVPLCIPSILIALAFVLFYGRQGLLNKFLMWSFNLSEPPISFLYSFWGVVFTHGVYNFPLVMGTVASRWRLIPREQEDAACLLKANKWRIFRTITLPQLKPAIISSAVLVFLYCFFSFGILLLFGGFGFSTLEVELYYTIKSSFDFSLAAVIALFETLLGLVIVSIYFLISKKDSSIKEISGTLSPLKPFESLKEKIFAIIFLAIICLLFGGPLISLIVSSFTVKNGFLGFNTISLSNYITLFTRTVFWKSFFTTICVSFFSATLATVVGVVLARIQKSTLSKILTMLPMAVSGIILGLGWMKIMPRGNVWVLIIAQASLFFPIALRQIQTGFEKIPPELEQAALLLGSSKHECLFRVLLPQIKENIITAWCFVFAASAGDITLPLVLSIPDFNSLSLLLYQLAGSYRFGEACCCGIVLGLCTGIFWLRKKRINK